MNSSQLLDEFFANIPRLKQVLGKMHDADSGGPTRAQMGILYVLSKSGPQSIKQMAEEFAMTSSGVTQLVDGLVKQDLVSRTEAETDRRKTSIALTKEGEKVLKHMHKRRIDALKKAFAPLSEEEIRQLSAMQKKIIDHFQNS